mmetsp:Transcript_3170/g.11072  ORF Transcript_3170/g.11072 Transcript_3170/m.11072 type:complete len:80 (-) Transcript_3170:1199-1438(-)
MSRYTAWVRKGLSLEAFKFVVYVTVPIGFVVYFLEPSRIGGLLQQQSLIVYPPEDEADDCVVHLQNARTASPAPPQDKE